MTDLNLTRSIIKSSANEKSNLVHLVQLGPLAVIQSRENFSLEKSHCIFLTLVGQGPLWSGKHDMLIGLHLGQMLPPLLSPFPHSWVEHISERDCL